MTSNLKSKSVGRRAQDISKEKVPAVKIGSAKVALPSKTATLKEETLIQQS